MRKLLQCLIVFYLFIIGITDIHAQNLGFHIVGNAKRIKIPFEIYNNLIVIPVVLNNRLPLKFILDTGVRTTILTEKAFSDILNLKYARKYTVAGIGEEKIVEAYVTNNVSLTLPGVIGRGHAMLVLEKDYLELRNYLGTDVHGVLGYEIFSRFIVQINYDKRELTLTTPEHFRKKRSYNEIPITVEDTKPYVEGHIVYKNGKHMRVKLLIDSGASHGLLLEEASDSDITIPDPHISTSLGRGLGGRLEGKIARLEYFHLGDKCWKDIIATFPQSNTFLDSLKGAGIFRHGSIGGEILSRFKVIINFPEEKLYLKPGKNFKKDFTYNLSGIDIKAKGSRLNSFEIVDVRKNSVGEEVGFKEGDMVVSINNIDAKNLNLNQVINFLNARENKKLKITVVRNGVRITRKFRLRSQI